MTRPQTRRLAATVLLPLLATALGLIAGAAPSLDAAAAPTGTAGRAHRPPPGQAEMGWRSRVGPDARSADARSYTPNGVLGIDVSSWQRNLNWPAWAARGRSFAFVKATEGSTYRNAWFARQYAGAYAAGMYRGAYHFANPAGRSGRSQAGYFVRHGGAWLPDGRTLPGVLDIEYNPYGKTCYGLSKAAMVRWIASFTAEYKRLTGRDAIIYTTTDWWRRCTGDSTRFSSTNPLWLARYGTTSPGTLPGAWPYATFWQYTATPLDQNWFNGTPDRLDILAAGVEPANPGAVAACGGPSPSPATAGCHATGGP